MSPNFPEAFKTSMESKFFWSAETEVTFSLQIRELDLLEQVK